jgi:hypothetical protein
MQVELVYDPSCPNREKARLQLLRAFAQLGIVPRWREWDAGSPESPPHVRGYGSPTILVNGRDASGETILGDYRASPGIAGRTCHPRHAIPAPVCGTFPRPAWQSDFRR